MDLIVIWNNFKIFLPVISLAFLLVFLITPLIGKFAKAIGAIDLPANLRGRADKSRDQRIHTNPKVRLGGLGVIIVFLVLTVVFVELTLQMKGILIGVGILFIGGFLDDKYELSAPIQMLFQLAAAIVAVIAGVSITQIGLFGNIDDVTLVAFQGSPIQILDFVYTFKFPSDIITIIWILIIMNAFNWLSGIDALCESITIVAAATIGFIGIKLGGDQTTFMAFILAGSVMGFLPYNFPPSKILGGTVGEVNYGFLLATLSILSGAKLSVTILLMIIPIADMIFVIGYRMYKFKVINPLKLLSISGRIHLHHRLMDMGFSDKLTLYFELTFFLLFAVLAFYIADFRIDFIITFTAVIVLILVFLIAYMIANRVQKRRRERPAAPVARIVEDMSPEDRYKY